MGVRREGITFVDDVGGSGGAAVTIADGADIVEGAIADVAVQGDNPGTISAKLRGLNKSIAAGITATGTPSITKTSGTLTNNLDEIVIDTTGMATLTVTWVSFAGGFDGNAYVKVSPDGGTTYLTALTHGNLADNWGSDFIYLPNYASYAQQYVWSVAGYDRAKVVLLDRTIGSAVIALQASAAVFDEPHKAVSIVGAGGKVVAVTNTGFLKVETQSTSLATVNTKNVLAPSSPAVVSVGVASGLAVLSSSRTGLKLKNLSTSRISLGFGVAAVLGSGVTLYPLDIFDMGEYDFTQTFVNAIASAAASNLSIQEYT
jgi:hypothetical protein